MLHLKLVFSKISASSNLFLTKLTFVRFFTSFQFSWHVGSKEEKPANFRLAKLRIRIVYPPIGCPIFTLPPLHPISSRGTFKRAAISKKVPQGRIMTNGLKTTRNSKINISWGLFQALLFRRPVWRG